MILITGATGHIGNVLVRRLAERYPDDRLRLFLLRGERLDAFDGLTLELFYGDTRDAGAVRRAVRGCRLVFHLAGLIETAPRKPQRLFDVNVGGARNVVEACLAESIERLIFVSSIHALADLPPDQQIVETEIFPVPDLLGPYAQSKSEATAVVYEGIARGLPAVIIFPTGVIGPHDYKLSELGRMFRHLNKQGIFRYTMSFHGAYDFVDVRDVVEGMVQAAERGIPGQGYLLSGHRLTMRDMIDMTRDALGQKRARVSYLPNWIVRIGAWLVLAWCRLTGMEAFFTPYSVDVLSSNSNVSHEKATRDLGYQPRPPQETIADTLSWMKEHGQL